MNLINQYTKLTHTFERVSEEFKDRLDKVELIYTSLGMCEMYHYGRGKVGEEVVVIFTGDGRIAINVILRNGNCDQIRHIFNNKGYFHPVETAYETTFGREVADEQEIHDTLKRFFEVS